VGSGVFLASPTGVRLNHGSRPHKYHPPGPSPQTPRRSSTTLSLSFMEAMQMPFRPRNDATLDGASSRFEIAPN